MALRVVGAGLGRTGTNSLKVALERLLGLPCYHMMEVFTHPEHPSGTRRLGATCLTGTRCSPASARRSTGRRRPSGPS